MFNTLKKTSLALLVASTALVQMSCKDDDESAKLGNWFRKDLPSYGGSIRTNAVSFVIGNVGYIGTGYTNEAVARAKDFWAYNAERQTWSQITPFPGTARNNATVDDGRCIGTVLHAVIECRKSCAVIGGDCVNIEGRIGRAR